MVSVQDSADASIVVERNAVPQVIQPEVTFDSVDYFYMALDHQIDGDYRDAIEDYNRALQQDHTLAPAALNRGVAYEQLGIQELAHGDFYTWATRDDLVNVQRNDYLEDGDTVKLMMNANTVYHIPFWAVRGQTLNVDVQALLENDVDPLIIVLDSYGNPVASSDDILQQDGSLISANSRIEDVVLDGVNCSASGPYTLLVTHAGGDTYGPLQIDFNLQ